MDTCPTSFLKIKSDMPKNVLQNKFVIKKKENRHKYGKVWDYKCGMGGYEHDIGIHACGRFAQAWTYGCISTWVYGIGFIEDINSYARLQQAKTKIGPS